MYTIKLSKQAVKDHKKLVQTGLSSKAKELIDIMKLSPYQNPPPYEKLVGNLDGYYSRRINIKHRMVYSVHETEKIVAIRSMWTHYE